jgi:hypothetical protein
MRIPYLKFILVIPVLIFSVLINSCSGGVSKLYNEQPDSYLSSKYENKSFKNVSMDICIPRFDFDNIPPYADSALVSIMKDFYEAFIEYFPQGIKTFSSVTKTGWIFFEHNYMSESIEYYTKTKDSLDFYLYLPDSLPNFQKKSNADFLIITQYASFSLSPKDSLNPKSKYSTVLTYEFSVWNRRTSDLVAMNKVTAKAVFDRLVNKWPYRGAIMKTAALFFEKLPMFQK